MKFLTLFVLSGLVFLTPMAAVADSYDGCIDYDVDVNFGIYVVDRSAEECAACGGGDTYSYTIRIHESGCDLGFHVEKHFCATASDIPLDQGDDSWFYVNSIGSGCDGTPNGCVRITPCP